MNVVLSAAPAGSAGSSFARASCIAVPIGAPLRAFSADRRELYPDGVWGGGPARPGTDVTMSARCIQGVLRERSRGIARVADTRAAGASAGADAYLVKSRFNAGVLLDTLARIGVRASP